MPLFTTVLEDTSPMLIYSPDNVWRPGSSESDSSEDQYSEASFFVSQVKGATMSFSFYGTSIAVVGAKRGNHGPYHATVDGVTSEMFSGLSTSSQFNQTLFSSESSLGQHDLIFINDDSTFLDIDYVAFQSSIGEDNESLIVNTFQDTHPAFEYTPSSSWGTPSNVGAFSGGSGHGTSDPAAVLKFSFQTPFTQLVLFSKGDAIALYGPVGPNSTIYTVQIDDGDPKSLNANQRFYRSQQILFFAGNLGRGDHTLSLNTAIVSGHFEFAIDYANVYTTPSLGGTFLGPSPVITTTSSASAQGTETCSSHAQALSPGVIAGLATTSVFGVLSAIFSVLIVWHYRRTFNSHIRSQNHVPGAPHRMPTNVPVAFGPFSFSTLETASALTARPYTKVPYPSELGCGFQSAVSVGFSTMSQSATNYTSTANHARTSVYSTTTQPPQYQ